jgi:hypothetical protein
MGYLRERKVRGATGLVLTSGCHCINAARRRILRVLVIEWYGDNKKCSMALAWSSSNERAGIATGQGMS